MNPWDQFTGANAGYVQELYERYQQDPGSVDEATRQAFARWAPPVEDGVVETRSGAPLTAGTAADLKAGIAAFTLAESVRRFGHLAAHTDPLGFNQPIGDPSLDPQAHGLTEETLRRLPADIVGGPAAGGAAHAWESHAPRGASPGGLAGSAASAWWASCRSNARKPYASKVIVV